MGLGAVVGSDAGVEVSETTVDVGTAVSVVES